MMKMRQLIAAAVVLAALAATLYWSNHHKPADTSAKTDATTKIISLTRDDINKLEIKKQGEGDVVLNRVGPDHWKITSPKTLIADENVVSPMLYALSPMDSATLIEEKAGDLKPFGLADPAVTVSVTEKDGKTQTLRFGDNTPTGDSAYVMLSGDPRLFSVAAATKTEFDKNLTDLRDKRLLPVDFENITSVQITNPKLNLTFGSDDGQWTVRIPKQMRGDTSKLEGVMEKLKEADMDPSTPTAEMNKAASLFASGTPVATVKATDASGTQELQVRKNGNAYYAKTTAMNGAYKVSNDLGKDVAQNLEEFREHRLFDFAAEDPDKVEMHDGPKAYYLTHSGEDYWSGEGKKMDPLSVQDFLRVVRTLTATKFVTSGFSDPTIKIVATSRGGKRVEKVDIAKTGANYIAKREDGPTLYELDPARIADLRKNAAAMKPAQAPPAKKK